MKTCLYLLLNCLLPLCACARPNVVFFLVDDLGYMDVSPNNPATFYETPHVQRLADSGMRFSNGYAANPVCSPTRYSIMTGRHPSRPDATNFFSGKRGGRFKPARLHDRMDLDEVTLAEALKEAGYRTCFSGKWHLGPTEAFWPKHQGFDVNNGGHVRGMPPSYFSPYRNPRLADGPKGEFLTARLIDESLAFIEANKDQPFLLYHAFYTVHTPLQAPAELKKKYQAKARNLAPAPEFGEEEQALPSRAVRKVRIRQNHATYAAMVESMDHSVGRILDRLQALGIDDNTVVCFTSDNGGLSTSEGSPTSNLPLRGGKGWTYEGGIRVPYLIRWPGVTKPASVCAAPVVSMDFYPTLLEICGLEARPAQHQDGRSLVSLLKGGKHLDRDALYWHYPHYSNQGGIPSGAIRSGDWKLIERFEDGRIHLYNLASDLSEQKDLAGEQPERADAMRKKLHAWYAEVDAKFLQPLKADGEQPWKP